MTAGLYWGTPEQTRTSGTGAVVVVVVGGRVDGAVVEGDGTDVVTPVADA
jgi:hypothetical protein